MGSKKAQEKTAQLRHNMKKNNSMNVTLEELSYIDPITESQQRAFKHWDDDYNLILSGSAGTGKTFIAMYLALEAMLNHPFKYQRIVIMRSVVPTRDIGFLPGTVEEKKEVFISPYKMICHELFGFDQAYSKLVSSKKILFETTSFLRGCTYDNCILFVDEMQNLNFHELDSVITRAGKNCKIIMSGDYTQSDFKYQDEKEGIVKFLTVIEQMRFFRIVNFGWEDIVRSDMVRDYIMTKEMLGF